jgi:hypothetical protein
MFFLLFVNLAEYLNKKLYCLLSDPRKNTHTANEQLCVKEDLELMGTRTCFLDGERENKGVLFCVFFLYSVRRTQSQE